MSFTANFVAGGNGSKSLILTGTNAGLNTISGVIRNATATAITSVQKTGPGTWQLTADNSSTNGYTGGTTVSGGTLLVNNAAGSGTGSGVVNVIGTGAPFTGGTLGGGDAAGTTGFIGGNVNISSATPATQGGTVAPGNSVGTLTFTGGAMTWNPQGNYVFEYDAAATSPAPVGGTSDLIRGLGTSTLDLAALGSGAGQQFNLTLLPANTPGTPPTSPVTYTIADFANPITPPVGIVGNDLTPFFNPVGSFAGPFSATLSGNQIQVTFTPVPEPAHVMLACVGATGVAGWWRKRKRA